MKKKLITLLLSVFMVLCSATQSIFAENISKVELTQPNGITFTSLNDIVEKSFQCSTEGVVHGNKSLIINMYDKDNKLIVLYTKESGTFYDFSVDEMGPPLTNQEVASFDVTKIKNVVYYDRFYGEDYPGLPSDVAVFLNGKEFTKNANVGTGDPTLNQDGYNILGVDSHNVYIQHTVRNMVNSATITAEVAPKADPSYVFTIPSNTTITQNETDPQALTGSVYVSDLENMDDKYVACTVTGNNLSDGTNTITTSYLYKASDMDEPAALEKFACGVGSTKGTLIYAQVTKEEWDKAAANPGTYTAKVVFNFSVEDKD